MVAADQTAGAVQRFVLFIINTLAVLIVLGRDLGFCGLAARYRYFSRQDMNTLLRWLFLNVLPYACD